MFEAWIHNSSIWSLICFFIVYISSLCLNLKIFNLIVFGSICLKPDGFIILLQFSSWTAFQFFIIIEHSSRTALQFFIIIHHSSWTAFHLFIIIQHSSRTALHFFNDISMNGMIIYTSIRNINPPFVYITLNKIFVYTAKFSFFSHAIHICSQSKTIGITGLYILNKNICTQSSFAMDIKVPYIHAYFCQVLLCFCLHSPTKWDPCNPGYLKFLLKTHFLYILMHISRWKK